MLKNTTLCGNSNALLWVIVAINEASATNSIMNFSHTLLFVIADAKALCSILYSSGNIQRKYCCENPPPLSYIKLAKTSVSWGLRKLIVWTSISSLAMSLYLSKPNKRMSDNILSFKLFKEISILNKLFRSFCLFSTKNGERKKKWSVVSVVVCCFS